MIFGKLIKPDLMNLMDLSGREVAVFAPLVVMVFWMGIYPNSFLEIVGPSVENLIDRYNTALAASANPAEPAGAFDIAALWQAARDGIAVALAD